MDRIFYVWSEKLIQECNRLPAVKNRASMVHDLITSYELQKHFKVVHSKPATYEDLRQFHSEIYIDHLKKLEAIDEDYNITLQDEECGIGYDCPPVSNMYELVTTVAGGSMTAAKCLLLGIADVAINWCGGWHHAQRFGAEGFCYINDIVLAIETLRKKFSKVLYIDLDVHHGNGVQDAYNLSKNVFTLSFHKYEPGFYPGSGGLDDIGNLVGKGYSVNFPFHAAYAGDTLIYAFEQVFDNVYAHFQPDAIVVQCGADALAHDPNGGANLTIASYVSCVRRVMDAKKPTLLLGGGGYNHANAARLWASLTASTVNVLLEEDIPDHEHWPEYGSEYTLSVRPSLVRDSNTKSYVDSCCCQIRENIAKYLGQNIEDVQIVQAPKYKKPRLSSDENIPLNRINCKQNPNKYKAEENKSETTNNATIYEFE